VRKAVDRKIKDEYKGSGMFFNWSRSSPATFAEKTKKFKQTDFLRGFAKKD